MRYTTIIDITEQPEVYRNQNARLLYLHLTLKSSYRDEDRDRVKVSVRQMAWQTGMSLSAARNALAVLIKAGLVKHEGGSTWAVTKFVYPEAISKRTTLPKNATQEDAAKVAQQRQHLTDELAKLRRWYTDFMNRGDENGAKEVEKEARKIQKQLNNLPLK